MTGHFLAPATKLSQKLCNNFGHFFSPFKCSITSSNLSASPFPPGTWCLSGDSFLWKLFSNIWGSWLFTLKVQEQWEIQTWGERRHQPMRASVEWVGEKLALSRGAPWTVWVCFLYCLESPETSAVNPFPGCTSGFWLSRGTEADHPTRATSIDFGAQR